MSSNLKLTFENVCLDKIKGTHNCVNELDKLAVAKSLVGLHNLKKISLEELKLIFYSMPIVVAGSESRGYKVVAGFVSFTLAEYLRTERGVKKLPVLVVKGRPDVDKLKSLALVDVFLKPMIASLGKGGGKHLGTLWHYLQEKEKEWAVSLFGEEITDNKLIEYLGQNNSSWFGGKS